MQCGAVQGCAEHDCCATVACVLLQLCVARLRLCVWHGPCMPRLLHVRHAAAAAITAAVRTRSATASLDQVAPAAAAATATHRASPLCLLGSERKELEKRNTSPSAVNASLWCTLLKSPAASSCWHSSSAAAGCGTMPAVSRYATACCPVKVHLNVCRWMVLQRQQQQEGSDGGGGAASQSARRAAAGPAAASQPAAGSSPLFEHHFLSHAHGDGVQLLHA